MTTELKEARKHYFKEVYYWKVKQRAPTQKLHKRGQAPKSLLKDV